MSEQISQLADQILYHKAKYYDGKPEISDSTYDKLEDQLRKLDPENPVLQIVGTNIFGTIKHYHPMLSCQKAKDLDEVKKWIVNNNIRRINIGYKVDGLSLSLSYSKGKLIQGLTRGDGQKGEDVTLNVMKVDVPKTIPVVNNVVIHGELYMKLSDFEKVEGDKIYTLVQIKSSKIFYFRS